MAKLLKLTDPLVKQSGMFYSRAIKGTQDGYFLSIEDYEEYLHDNNIEVNGQLTHYPEG